MYLCCVFLGPCAFLFWVLLHFRFCVSLFVFVFWCLLAFLRRKAGLNTPSCIKEAVISSTARNQTHNPQHAHTLRAHVRSCAARACAAVPLSCSCACAARICRCAPRVLINRGSPPGLGDPGVPHQRAGWPTSAQFRAVAHRAHPPVPSVPSSVTVPTVPGVAHALRGW